MNTVWRLPPNRPRPSGVHHVHLRYALGPTPPGVGPSADAQGSSTLSVLFPSSTRYTLLERRGTSRHPAPALSSRLSVVGKLPTITNPLRVTVADQQVAAVQRADAVGHGHDPVRAPRRRADSKRQADPHYSQLASFVGLAHTSLLRRPPGADPSQARAGFQWPDRRDGIRRRLRDLPRRWRRAARRARRGVRASRSAAALQHRTSETARA